MLLDKTTQEPEFLGEAFPMCGSRKYPYSHHGRNWKFQRGGGSKAQEILEG